MSSEKTLQLSLLVNPATGLPYTTLDPMPVNIGSTVDRINEGDITSTQSYAVSTVACGTASIQISLTWTGTINFEYSTDAIPTWHALLMDPVGGGPQVTSTTANGVWTAACAGFTCVRAVGATVASGTVHAYLVASTATNTVVLGDSLPSGDNTIGRVKITDGSDVALVSAAGALITDGSASVQPVSDNGGSLTVDGTVIANAGSGSFTVAGVAAAAAAPSGNPVLVAGSDGSAVRTLLTDSSSRQIVAGAGTAGTPTAGILTVQGAASMTAIQIGDNSGSLTVDTPQLPVVLGATTKSASLSVAPATDSVGTAGSASTTVYTVQGAASMTAVQVGDNSASLTVDSPQLPAALGQGTAAQSLSTVFNSNQVGTAGTASSTVLTVQGVTSMTPVQVGDNGSSLTVDGTVAISNSFALDATLAKLTITQGTALGSNTIAMVGGSVLTAAPTYTTGQVSPLSLTTAGNLRVDGSTVTQPVSAASLPLPSGASTSALQTTGNTSLSSIDTKTPALGQATMANSSPVVIASNQVGSAGTAASNVITVQGIASMTPVQIGDNSGSITVDGTVTANAGTGNFTVIQGTASNLLAQVFGGAATGAAVSGNPVLMGGSDGTNARSLKTDTSGQPVVVGAGTAGSASGGVLTVQGAASMTAVQIADNSGSLTVDSGQLPAALGQTTAANSFSVVHNSNQVGTAGTASTTVFSVQGIASGTNLSVAQAPAASLNATVTGSGSAGSAATGVLTVQGIASMTPLQVGDNSGSLTVDGTVAVSNSFALDATLAKLTVTQGTALGSNTVAMMGGSVTTAPPTYTTGQISPLSLATTGALRTQCTGIGTAGSADTGVQTIQGIASMTPVQVSQATASNLNAQVVGAAAAGAAISGNPILAGGSDGTNARALSTDTSGRLVAVGAAATGAAVAGNPLLVAGSDGTNARSLKTATDGTLNVQTAGSYARIASATTTTVKSGAGILKSFSVGLGGVVQTFALYDNTAGSGTLIAGVTTLATTSPFCLPYDVSFSTGLTVVSTGVSVDATVSYK